MYLEKLNKEAIEKIKEPLINYIEDFFVGEPLPELDLILYHVYNEDYFIIGIYEAEEFLKEAGGCFYCIGIVKEYEEENFGKIYTDISYPENVSNALAYIIGEEIIYSLETLREYEGQEVTEEIKAKILQEIRRF